MAKIAIDCDGVLANFTKAFVREANHMWPGRCDPNFVQTNWDDIGGLSADEIDQVWRRIDTIENWWMTLDPFHHNVGALTVFLYMTKRHDVYIVTGRHPSAGQTVAFQTDVWLRACGVQALANYLGVLAVDHWHDKRVVYKAAQFDFSVDDKAETVEICDTLKNHTAFLLNQPWNQQAKVKRRIKSLDEFFAAIDSRYPKAI